MESENLDLNGNEEQANIHKYACIFAVSSILLGVLIVT